MSVSAHNEPGISSNNTRGKEQSEGESRKQDFNGDGGNGSLLNDNCDHEMKSEHLTAEEMQAPDHQGKRDQSAGTKRAHMIRSGKAHRTWHTASRQW